MNTEVKPMGRRFIFWTFVAIAGWCGIIALAIKEALG